MGSLTGRAFSSPLARPSRPLRMASSGRTNRQESRVGCPGVAFGGDSFVAVGEPRLILSSTDAINWTQHATRVDGLQGVTYGNGSFVAVGGYYTDHPRGVAVQSGGRPQMCLETLGLGPA